MDLIVSGGQSATTLCFGPPRFRVTKIAPQHYVEHDRYRVCAAAHKSQEL